jgi:F-type H+-transporting ATPase subunit gamma
MAASQRDVKQRIDSVKNIRKITRAMEMVAAARLRRAEQRIAHLRPYAGAIRRMTRQAAEAAGSEISNLPILKQHENENRVAILLVTGDRGLAGAFNSQILRAGLRAASEYEGDGRDIVFYASGRRGVSSLGFRGREVAGGYTGFTDRPSYADARGIAEDLITAYVDDLVPDYVEISIYRALLESTASEHGARMTAMRNASQNAGEVIDDLTLEMNRARQAEITQEIMEVVAGAEALV